VRVGGTTKNVDDSNRLIKQLKNTHPSNLADVVLRAGPLWNQCWGNASSSHIVVKDVEVLLQTLAKIPFSQETKLPPPPIHALSSAMKRYLKSNSSDPLLAAETALNVVRKVSCFEWSENRLVVKEALGKILEDAANQLLRRNQDHRDCLNRIDACLDELDKPWMIKEKNQVDSTMDNAKNYDGMVNQAEEDGVTRHHHSLWRVATVEWLLQSSTFSPAELPKMQGPSTKSRGVYKNREHYFDTMLRLLVAMAFHEGHCALAPQCWERCSGGQSCGGALVRLPGGFNETEGTRKNDGGSKSCSSGPLRCRGRGCRNVPVLICKSASHLRGLCERCSHHELEQLLGPNGSTHVYNGSVGTVDGASGKLYVQNFFSRKAPLDENGMDLSTYSLLILRPFSLPISSPYHLITKETLVQYTGGPQKGLPSPI
jgi:hypothetical protein